MGCDIAKEVATRHELVSIHAPVWGATAFSFLFLFDFDVSIHAPVWGATDDVLANRPVPVVSIHAPVWGATTQKA